MSLRRPTVPTAMLVAAVVASSGCGATSAETSGEVVVLAAGSLTEAFTAIEVEFEIENPKTDLVVSFGSSSSLATQVNNGAPVDVFASADGRNMDKVVSEGLAVGKPEVFASNTLEIVVPAGNPGQIEDLDDLVAPELILALGAPEVPVGRAAREALTRAGIRVPETSQEPDVKAVMSRVQLGQADAGIVWTTDVLAAGDQVSGVPVPAEYNVRSDYPIALISTGRNREGAREFIALVRSDRGGQVLAEHGFGMG